MSRPAASASAHPVDRHVPEAWCMDCDEENVRIITCAPPGYGGDGDHVYCADCGARGVFFRGGIVWAASPTEDE